MTITRAGQTTGLIDVLVRRKAQEAEQVFSFVLTRQDGALLPAFEAGSHIDVHLADGTIRQYSLCGRLDEQTTYTIAVLRDEAGRGGSRQVCDTVAENGKLRISPPRNLFALDPTTTESVLIAGGIGITPIMSMAESLDRENRPFRLFYASRTRSRMAFADQLVERFGSRISLHFDDDAATTLNLGAAIGPARAGLHLYVCGPSGLIEASLLRARQAGWTEDALHFERFEAKQEIRDSDSSFEIELASTGRRVVVARGQSAIDALEGAGIELDYSCEMGICGTCVTRVLSGVPDHRDHFLSPKERARNDRFTPCCSRSTTPVLVIDL